MRALYERMHEEGTYRLTWQAGPTTVEGWLEYLRDRKNHVVLVSLDGEIVVCAWVNGLTKWTAFVHHWFSRQTWGAPAMEIAGHLLDYWFSFPGIDGDEHLFRVLVGQTPADNHMALMFAARLGFELSTVIPYVDGVGTVISFLTRERFYGRKS